MKIQCWLNDVICPWKSRRHCGIRRNAGYLHVLLFPQCFLNVSKAVFHRLLKVCILGYYNVMFIKISNLKLPFCFVLFHGKKPLKNIVQKESFQRNSKFCKHCNWSSLNDWAIWIFSGVFTTNRVSTGTFLKDPGSSKQEMCGVTLSVHGAHLFTSHDLF